jgi:hypothetical protein
MKALAHNRDERYQSAAEFRSALRRYLKSSAQDWDNVVIGKFMREIFSDRIKEKRQLIDSAQESDSSIRDSLFGDLSDYLSDTEHSVPRSPVSGSALLPHLRRTAVSKRRSVWLIVLALVCVMAGAGAVALFVLMKEDQGTKKADAGLIAVVDKPDAGTPTPPDDTPKDSSKDAGLAPADEGQPEKIAKPPKKKKKKKKKRRRRRVVSKSRPRDRQESSGS